jgi:hypothetical protein
VDTPKWLERLDETNWLLAVLVGAFMLTYSLTLAAAAEILKAHVSTTDSLIAFVVFALASITSIVAPSLLSCSRRNARPKGLPSGGDGCSDSRAPSASSR